MAFWVGIGVGFFLIVVGIFPGVWSSDIHNEGEFDD